MPVVVAPHPPIEAQLSNESFQSVEETQDQAVAVPEPDTEPTHSQPRLEYQDAFRVDQPNIEPQMSFPAAEPTETRVAAMPESPDEELAQWEESVKGLVHEGAYAEAEQVYETCFKLLNAWHQAPAERQSNLNSDRAAVRIKLQRWGQAEGDLKTALRLNPQNMVAKRRSAKVHFERGAAPAALVEVEAVLRADPNDAEALEIKQKIESDLARRRDPPAQAISARAASGWAEDVVAGLHSLVVPWSEPAEDSSSWPVKTPSMNVLLGTISDALMGCAIGLCACLA